MLPSLPNDSLFAIVSSYLIGCRARLWPQTLRSFGSHAIGQTFSWINDPEHHPTEGVDDA